MRKLLEVVKTKKYWVSLAVATLLYFFTVQSFQKWYYHQSGLDIRPADLFTSFGPKFFQAEPLELVFYFGAYLAVPFLAYVVSPLIAKVPRPNWKWVGIITGLAILVGGGILLSRINFDFVGQYLERRGVVHALWLLTTKRLYVTYIILFLSFVSFILFYFWKEPDSGLFYRSKVEQFFKKFAPWGLILLAVFIFHPNFPLDPHHYNYFIGSLNDIYQGKGKGILYESSHLYGLFNIYFLAGFFKVLPFSFTMLALLVMTVYFFFFVVDLLTGG